jgi:hypothetical protein
MHFPTSSVERYSSVALEHQKMHRTPILQSSGALETCQYWHDCHQQSKQKKEQGNVC